MKKSLLIPILLLASMLCHSQYIYKIKADSVLITNDSCNAELNLENSTKNVNGFLYNKGNGRTEFRKAMIKENDSVYVFGGDTLRLGNLSGSYIQNQNSSGQNGNFWITGDGRVNGKLLIKDAAILSSSNSSGYSIVFNSNPGYYESIELGFPSNPSYQNKGLKFNEYQGASWVWADGNNGANNRFLKVGGTGGTDIFTGSSTIRLRAVANTGNILIGKTADDSLNKLQVEGNISVNTTLRTPNVSGTNIVGKTLKIAGGKSTGSAAGGNIEFYSTPAGVSGGTLNSEILRMTLLASGNLGIGITPNAKLHIAAGSSSAGMAPVKLTAGTNLSTPENGAIEYDGTNYFVTSGSNRYTLAKTLTSNTTLNFASTTAQNSSDLTITVTGAADGDAVYLGVPGAAVNANSSYSAWVSAADTVMIRFNNYSSGTIDPASGTFRVSVVKY